MMGCIPSRMDEYDEDDKCELPGIKNEVIVVDSIRIDHQDLETDLLTARARIFFSMWV